MSKEISYTTEEIAQLLRVSKLTVYDLIKKGELPAYRVGRQMRVDAADLEAYKQRSKGEPYAGKSMPPTPPVWAAQEPVRTLQDPVRAMKEPVRAMQESIQAAQESARAAHASTSRPIIISGQDVCLDLLANQIEKKLNGIRPLRSYLGSLNGLLSMYNGESDVVSTHLLDADTQEYNIPYIRKILVGQSYLVVNVMSRWAGLYVQPGNPLKLEKWEDLGRSGIKLVNREKGSGARVLLDEQLRINGISKYQITGYENEESSHLGVASVIASGQADVGVGIEKAARLVGIEFVPLIQERYDFVLLKTAANQMINKTILEILQSPSFQQEIESLGGYDTSRMGQVLFETE